MAIQEQTFSYQIPMYSVEFDFNEMAVALTDTEAMQPATEFMNLFKTHGGSKLTYTIQTGNEAQPMMILNFSCICGVVPTFIGNRTITVVKRLDCDVCPPEPVVPEPVVPEPVVPEPVVPEL